MRKTVTMSADRLAAVVVTAAALAVAGLFFWMLIDVVSGGLPALSWEFFTAPPANAGRSGGVSTVIVSTLLVLVVCLAAAAPLGLAAAAFLAEFTKRNGLTARLLGRGLDLLAATPSIVFGLFAMTFFCQTLGMGQSILAGGLTLGCMVLPILIRSAEAGIRSTDDDLRRAAAALGLSRSATLLHLLLPAAAQGVAVGLVLGIGRALSETAALIYTSGYVLRMPTSLFDSGRTLSVHIYDLAMHVPGGETNARASVLVLMALLLVINLLAVQLTDLWLTRRARQ